MVKLLLNARESLREMYAPLKEHGKFGGGVAKEAIEVKILSE